MFSKCRPPGRYWKRFGGALVKDGVEFFDFRLSATIGRIMHGVVKNRPLLTIGLGIALMLALASGAPAQVFGATPASPQSAVTAATLTCSGATTLEELVSCIKGQMPSAGSEGFLEPNSTERSDWLNVVGQMLDGQCEGIALPSSFFDSSNLIYQVTSFNDNSNGQSYCVLMEILDADLNGTVDRGRGTFVTNASASRQLSIQVPHPIFDSGTPAQGIGVFKGTNSRSFLMAGTHRHSNSLASACQSSFLEADVAHCVDNMFHSTVKELQGFYVAQSSFTTIQLHGMGTSTCPGVDVYMTNGINTPPQTGDTLLSLKSNLLAENPEWVVTVPGDSPSCGLHGSTNVQGRLLNGVPAADVCTTAASSYTGKFIHVEQTASFRNANDWINAINNTYEASLPPTPVPAVSVWGLVAMITALLTLVMRGRARAAWKALTFTWAIVTVN